MGAVPEFVEGSAQPAMLELADAAGANFEYSGFIATFVSDF